MSLPAIEVTGLAKRYVIEHESRHDSLRDTLHHAARKVWRRARWGTGFEKEEFWALKDVSFSVQPGEVVGVIGRNGAGKSTLLKILSRITEPTKGRVTLRGRVASLLEVGTGFHPDLSGRENIFLNGAILGMSRREISGKFDEIVAFAEVEKFLDTPVKRYSSGMYVRLAFAVAAHLEPEILIVDEVLAVGDSAFQQKCIGKMQAVARSEGRTVLFVSHNLSAIRQLCPRSIFLRQGRVAAYGETETVVADYFHPSQVGTAQGGGIERVRTSFLPELDLALVAADGTPLAQVASGQEARLRISYRQSGLVGLEDQLGVSIVLYLDGQRIANLWNLAFRSHHLDLRDRGIWECVIPRWPFRAGTVQADLYVHHDSKVLAWLDSCATFQSLDANFHGGDVIPASGQGLVFVDHHWTNHAPQ